MEEIIIIGAGAAGLMCGCELASKGKTVTILEARNRIGGRMHTIHDSHFLRYVEEGAEFIHGDLPLTRSLLIEAGIQYYPLQGKFYRHSKDSLSSDNSFIEDDNGLIKKLKAVKNDMTVKEFLDLNFDETKDAVLIHSIKKFVEGYDSAEYDRMSLFAFRDEWISEEDASQYHIAGGYSGLYNHLSEKFQKAGGRIVLNTIVNEIIWQRGNVKIKCNDGKSFESEKVIVTVPTGVLKDAKGKAYIKFNPVIEELEEWNEKTGYGSLVKILLEFKFCFWDDHYFKSQQVQQAANMFFLFSEEKIPTWWTQLPDQYALLTGWLAGPEALKMKNSSDEEILEFSLSSLSTVFKISVEQLKENLTAWHVKNWTTDPFTKGAYTYKTPFTENLLKKMEMPFEETVYFAGEAYYEGKEMGTIEAALVSGLNASKLIR